MKRILGLDLGTNSIGWAMIETNFEKKEGNIKGLGSRIIPMSQAILSEFGKGNTESPTAQRTEYRGKRRLIQRTLLRRERLHRVLNIIDFLPKHYTDAIDFEKRLGQFKDNSEPKIAYKIDSNNSFQFLFTASYNEMVEEFKQTQPQLFGNRGKEGKGKARKIPYDWTLYYLRKKALNYEVSKEELSWILLNFNQKRGYYQLREENEIKIEKGKSIETFDERVIKVEKTNPNQFKITLSDGTIYFEDSYYQITFENDLREIKITSQEKIDKKSGEVEIVNTKEVQFIKSFLVADVIDTGEVDKKELKSYKVKLDNGIEFIKKKNIKNDLTWKGKPKTVLFSYKIGNKNSLTISAPEETNWTLVKKKTEQEINQLGIHVCEFIYGSLLKNPTEKINGKLVSVIERKFYKNELYAILEKQKEFHSELKSDELLEECAEHLYSNNYAHKNNLKKEKGKFTHLFLNDIIFYQRPLKSKKSLIAECKYEFREYIDQETNEKKKQYVKCIAKSHPLFQEFRLWEFVQNLKIHQREKLEGGRLKTDVNVTSEFLTCEDDYVKLFEFLNDKKSIKQSVFLSHFKLKPKIHRWNYVEENEYPCNETRASFISVLKKDKAFDWKSLLIPENEEKLWHTLYSINNKEELKKALKKLAVKLKVVESVFEPFDSFPPFKKDYGSFSSKALKKLLPLMRKGKYWLEDNIHPKTKDRIDKIVTGEFDEKIRDRVREKAINLNSINDFKGLPLWLASYIVYDRHSEADDLKKWKQPSEITLLKQHSLRNPIVEQIINETLQVVRDIWMEYGNGKEDFFDEIHVELGRDMKNPKNVRERMTKQISGNKNTNERVRLILKELMNDESIEGNVKDYIPSHQDIFKIYEDGVLTQFSEVDLKKEKIEGKSTAYDVSRKSDPSQKEIQKYKLWLDQKYQSPYTGEIIPLSKLFTPEYEIEHVLPKSRYIDNSMSNKVICEAEVNKRKDNQTGYEFIENHGGEKITIVGGRVVEVSKKDTYEQFVKRNFKGKKKDIMLMVEIPEDFTNRQLNDSRYISKLVLNLMSKIVREDDEQDPTSKKVIPVTGKITSRLKKDWGFNEVWNDLVTPRFKRMNELVTKEGEDLSTDFGFDDFQKDKNGKNIGKQFFRTQVPDELKKDFEKKRIDHRHHALDALVIALASRSHVNYLNNKNAADSKKKERIDLKKTLCFKTKPDSQGNYRWDFHKPWENITKKTESALENTVVSFKQNKRVLTKTNNYYESYKEENDNLRLDKEGNPKKGFIKQKGKNRSIRKPLHQETVHGKISLRDKKTVSFSNGLKDWKKLVDKELKTIIKKLVKEGQDDKMIVKHFKKKPYCVNGNEVKKVEIYYFRTDLSATRKTLDTSFNEKTIEAITDTGIQLILKNHLKQDSYQNKLDEKGKAIAPESLAFSPEGIEDMNKNIRILNNGKTHQPIYKVRKYEALGKKFPVGEKGNRKDKFVVSATNMFFAVYMGTNKKSDLVRQFNAVPLNVVIENLKQGNSPVPERFIDKEKCQYSLQFTLSPNDLVYVPTDGEIDNPNSVDFKNLSKEQINRIYLFTDGSGTTANFIPNSSANIIFNMTKKDQVKKELNYSIQNEYGIGSPQSKNQKSIDGIMIKERCWKLKIDRLGNVSRV